MQMLILPKESKCEIVFRELPKYSFIQNIKWLKLVLLKAIGLRRRVTLEK